MPAVLKLNQQGASVGVWHITERDEELLAQLQLNEAERQLIDSLKHSRRYLHWLSSRVMLRQLINTDKFIELTSDEKRKPTLKNFPHNVSFSHSHDMAAVIISEHDAVGIDIELINPKVLRVKHKFLSEEALKLIDSDGEVLELITCWCAKEALFKLYGKGGVDFIADLHLKLPLPPDGIIEAEISKDHTSHLVHTMHLDHIMGSQSFDAAKSVPATGTRQATENRQQATGYILAFVIGEVSA
jgi:phosphopantetheinyl transferase